jgi:DNA polymerase-3 subunit epsilon
VILLSLDFETTGLNRQTDRITEVGAVLWTTARNRTLETQAFFVDAGLPVPQEVTDLTGIHPAMIKKFGVEEDYAVDEILRMALVADAYIGQNVKGFDREFLLNAAKRLNKTVPEKIWIDTCTDLPGVEKQKLTLMAAEAKDPKTGRHCGFVNPFPHSALSDAMTVLQLVSLFDIEAVMFRARQPEVVLQALHKFDDNHQAKKLGFVFKSDLGKRWLKVVKQSDVDELAKSAPFNVSIVTDVTPQQIWYS